VSNGKRQRRKQGRGLPLVPLVTDIERIDVGDQKKPVPKDIQEHLDNIDKDIEAADQEAENERKAREANE